MRLHGYCTKCRKIRPVRVTRPRPLNNVQTGICASCERKEDDERRARTQR
jgi:hypothetical protein